MAASGWGASSWGGSPWGGATLLDEAPEGVTVLAHRENVFRVFFPEEIYFSDLLDAADASDPTRYTITPVEGSIGLDGSDARPVTVVRVQKPTVVDGLAFEEVGKVIDLVLDRPMTSYSAHYDVVLEVYLLDQATVVAGTVRVPAVFRQIQRPTVDAGAETRDLANPQTASAAGAGTMLGSYAVDDSGDYAFDEGVVSFRKRVLRRLMSSVNGFAHLPGYGVGVPDHGKRLASRSTVSSLVARAEAQVSLEPEAAQVRVHLVTDPNTPGLARLQVFVRSRQGPPQRFDLPILSG